MAYVSISPSLMPSQRLNKVYNLGWTDVPSLRKILCIATLNSYLDGNKFHNELVSFYFSN